MLRISVNPIRTSLTRLLGQAMTIRLPYIKSSYTKYKTLILRSSFLGHIAS